VVAGSRLNKVLIDGGSGLNVLFTKTLKKMKLDITHMLTKSTSPFYDIVPGNATIPLGSVVLPVTFGEIRENYRTEYTKFEVTDMPASADQLSPSSWQYLTTHTWYSRCQVRPVYSHYKGT
jgi:hypothetical protein